MKQVCFLLPEGIVMPATMLSAIEIFEAANDFLLQNGESSYYEIGITGTNVKQSLHNSKFMIQPDKLDYRKVNPDLIIIPGLHWQNNFSLSENKDIIEWMISQHNQGCELASLCTGSFFLAATGLLNGRECSTHWRGEQLFVDMYPDVKLCTDKVITDNGGIYTSGGALSSLNLILYIVEKYSGREVALYCAKVLQIDIERSSQSPFMLFTGQKGHPDEAIRKVQQFIENNIEKKVSVESLAEMFSMSKRSFIRRFKNATNDVPVEYIRKVKIEAAKRIIEKMEKNINEVMYAIGYTDNKAFRDIFKKITGLTPLEYKAKFSYTTSKTIKQIQ